MTIRPEEHARTKHALPLRIKTLSIGTTENAVKTQVRIAISVYFLIAIVRKRLKPNSTLYQILQILSVIPLGKSHLTGHFSSYLLESRAIAYQKLVSRRIKEWSSQPARLNLPQREPLEPSFCMALSAMWRSTARLSAAWPMRVLS
jgi:hypothetical protein